jgi:hypothetical protein
MRHLAWFALVAGLIAGSAGGCAGSEDETQDVAAAQCGPTTCATNEYCCDAKCGLCVEMEVACNMTCP